MAITKTQDGSWIIYSGTDAEVAEALQDDGVTQAELLGFSVDAGTVYACVKKN